MKYKVYTLNKIPSYEDGSIACLASYLSVVSDEWETDKGQKLATGLYITHTSADITKPIPAPILKKLLDEAFVKYFDEHTTRVKGFGVTPDGKRVRYRGLKKIVNTKRVLMLSEEKMI